ncbi:hypothetical protein PYJP_13680 [Pyrofollis japonicus]|uniref:SWIM zinc finger family protein n=1 Tax=Pyrofollis japonicus TaxID=3060460 RepID=UPI00295A5D95|nr:SWIM zinc finger family protein [Pyrofollis japonicus]BEP18016.1 hypothetical protein PYJP_13680 [Pyrofollis japonicus]
MPKNGAQVARDRLSELISEVIRLSENPPPAARSAAGELRVVRLSVFPLELWAVMGRESDYLVIRRMYCNCPHFSIRVVNEEKTVPCYHLIAVELAEKTGRFHDLSASLNQDELLDIVLEILSGARSTTLRKKLYMNTAKGIEGESDK